MKQQRVQTQPIINFGDMTINQLNYGVMKLFNKKFEYIHNNPVEGGFVFRPEDYKYSSAIDYAGQKGIIENVVVFQYFKL